MQKLPPGSKQLSLLGRNDQIRPHSDLSGDRSVFADIEESLHSIHVHILREDAEDIEFEMVQGSNIVTRIRLSYDGKKIAIGRRYPGHITRPSVFIDIYDTQTGQLLGIIKSDSQLLDDIHFTRDGNRLLGIGVDMPDQSEFDWDRAQLCIDIWDLKEMRGGQILRGHTDSIDSIDISSNGKSVASVSRDGTLKLFDIESGTCKWTATNFDKADPTNVWSTETDMCVTFSTDDQWIFTTGTRHRINQWNALTGERSKTIEVNFKANRSIYPKIINRNAMMLQTSSTGPTLFAAVEGHLGLIDLSKDDPSYRSSDIEQAYFMSLLGFDKHKKMYLLVNPLKRYIERQFTTTNTIQLLDAQNGKILWEKNAMPLNRHLKHIYPNQIQISPDGRWIAAPLTEKSLLILDRKSGRTVKEIPIQDVDGFPVCWTTDSQRLIHGGNDGKLHIWNPSSGTELLSIKAHRRQITCLAVSPDGTKIISGGKDGLIKVWDAAAMK